MCVMQNTPTTFLERVVVSVEVNLGLTVVMMTQYKNIVAIDVQVGDGGAVLLLLSVRVSKTCI